MKHSESGVCFFVNYNKLERAGLNDMAVDYQQARESLNMLYRQIATSAHEDGVHGAAEAFTESSPAYAVISDDVKKALSDNKEVLDIIFNSKTQSYREVLLGCALIHLLDPSVNIRLPYINHGDGSFNGRSLDEYAVNPFLQEQLFPCSKGPYLAAFRRSVKLIPETAEGLRDKTGYSAMMDLLSVIESCDTNAKTSLFIICLLHRFIELRNASIIPLARIGRFSIEQYGQLLSELLRYQSGGLLPVIITVAFFQMLAEHYLLPWEITWQGINVADNATGAEGDVTIKSSGQTVLAIEITERPLDQRRIVSTFNTKIIHNDVKEYLFVYTNTEPDETARQTARNLFSQGYEINFANVAEMILNNFLVLPASARDIFTNKIMLLLESREVPSTIKVKWNDAVKFVLQI
ncbi:MAG: hypothetical protein LBJ10_08455 [Clostridiales bacterium]|nr:hypothetical protein [Clostridiales bacterium]